MALGFFSTAYTFTFRSALSAALSKALTRGPLPAPTTITVLDRKLEKYNENLQFTVEPALHRFSAYNVGRHSDRSD